LPLTPRRRIFTRRKRLSPAALILRSVVILAFGVTAALGATLVAAKWPEGPEPGTIAARLPTLRPEQKVMRVAAVSPRRPPEQSRDPGRKP